jgi:AcrR family transcriptional regulator
VTGRAGPRREGPGRPRDPAADAAILRAAAELLVERGVDRISIELIARRAGVAKVTVYRRWSSKEELLAQAIETVRDDIPAATVVDGPTGALPATIEEFLPRWGAVLADPRFRALSARLLAAGHDHPPLLAAYRMHHVRPRRERARAAMLRAQEDGVLDRAADVDVLIDMMEGAVIQYLLLQPEPLDPAEITAYLRRLLRQAGFPLRATTPP